VASVDLLFQAPPLTTGDLVFGDDGSSTVSDATISGEIVLAGPTLEGEVVLGIVASGEVTLVGPTLEGEVQYFTDTRRPLVANARVRWQDAEPQSEEVDARWGEASRLPAYHEARFQDATARQAGFVVRWKDSDRTRRPSLRARFQDSVAVQRVAQMRFQDASRTPNVNRQRYADAQPVQRATAQRFQDGVRGIAGQHRVRYQDAAPLQRSYLSLMGTAKHMQRGWGNRYQECVQPRPGRTHLGPPAVVPPDNSCYVPSTDLVFEMPWSADTNLVFFCEAHEGGGPEPGSTVVVPVRRIYTVINSATLKRVDGDVLIPTLAMTLTIDVDSWTWGFTARAPGAAEPDLQPTGGVPVEVEATINGVAYRAIVEGLSRDRVFGRSDLNVTGRGKAAVLDAPYSPVMTFGNTGDRTVQQLANDVLTLNGVSIGWDVDAGWQPDDWLVPANVWLHQGTYITALNAIAGAAGAYVQPHPTDKALRVLRRYPALPWDWGDVTPDFELPSDVVQREGIVWTDKAIYNRVFVRGMKSGRMGQATRTGTAGDLEAPMVTDALITAAVGARQRAVPVLADVGRQAAVSLRLPVLEETGVITPGNFVRYVDGGVTRIGLVRSTSAEVERADERLTIWQTIGVETHDDV
jgi:hypothetical protein